MAAPILYDAVTLRHFSSVSRLDLLEACHAGRSEPRWSEAVYHEVDRARLAGFRECASVLAFEWLGHPIPAETEDLRGIMAIKVRLGSELLSGDENEGRRHLGEAESIHLARRHGFCFATDDNEAHRLAEFDLGSDRVFDTIDILRFSVANGDLTTAQAVDVATNIRAMDRSLRAPYERLLLPSDFL